MKGDSGNPYQLKLLAGKPIACAEGKISGEWRKNRNFFRNFSSIWGKGEIS
jgi:hypothetical protein